MIVLQKYLCQKSVMTLFGDLNLKMINGESIAACHSRASLEKGHTSDEKSFNLSLLSWLALPTQTPLLPFSVGFVKILDKMVRWLSYQIFNVLILSLTQTMRTLNLLWEVIIKTHLMRQWTLITHTKKRHSHNMQLEEGWRGNERGN